MMHQRPRVTEGILFETGDTTGQTIIVGSQAWYDWLREHSSFRFEAPDVAYTARKEQRSGGWYWYAQRRKHGKLHTTYLGKSDELSLHRLDEVAEQWRDVEEAAVAAQVGDRRAEFDSTTHLWPVQPVAALVAERASQGERMRPSTVAVPNSGAAAEQGTASGAASVLPQPLTPLVGRGAELREITDLLQTAGVRLVNLIGPGGTGKTRLAVAVASQLRGRFRDGVYFLQLAPVRDPRLVAPAIAQALGLRTDGHKSILDLLKRALQDQQILLVLDNMEQVTPAAAAVAELIHACPDLRVLVTSREVLRVSGEHPYAVAPLPFPDPAGRPSGEIARNYPAVDLFLQRARAIAPGLVFDDENILTIARICAQVEGLPLAIELAAARVRLLPPQALSERLTSRLNVLTQGGPDLPARQQTLRATFEWSYDLLSQDEQRVFRRLGVFSGGCELEAAERVCTAPGDVETAMLEVVTSLVDKSLLLPSGENVYPPRVVMADTVHEFVSDLLARSGELEVMQEAHAAYFLSFAEQVEPLLWQREQEEWLARLDREGRNLRAALGYLLETEDRVRSVRLAGALGRYWYARGGLSEGLEWTERALSLRDASGMGTEAGAGEAVSLPEDRHALFHAGFFATLLDQGERAQAWLEESIALSKGAGDVEVFAVASHMLVLFFLLKGNLAIGEAQAEKTLETLYKSSDPWSLACAHSTSATLAVYFGDFRRAYKLFERSEALFKESGDLELGGFMRLLLADAMVATGDRTQAQAILDEEMGALHRRRTGWSAGYLLCAYGQFALQHGDWSRARLLLELSLDLSKHLRDPRGMARAYLFLAQTALHQQDYTNAIGMALECLRNARLVGAMATIIGCLEELADVAVRRGKMAWAAQLWGAAERQRQATDPQFHPLKPAERAQLVKTARYMLGNKTFGEAWEEGRLMSVEQLLSTENVAKSVLEHRAASSAGVAALTRREREVLLLVADGLTNAEIAERLVITPATVTGYLNIIYKKINVSSRTAAMRYVIDHQLS